MRLVEKLKAKIKERALDAGIGALIVGGIASLFGVDIAPTEVDTLVTAAATLIVVFERWRATRT